MAISIDEQSYPPLDKVLSRLKGVRKSLRGWVACCPAHHDHQPSLSIGLGNEGHILLKCFAGCSLEQIIATMDLAMADVFSPALSTSNKHGTPNKGRNISLIDLAVDKLLPWQFLFNMGVMENESGALQIPYHLQDGTLASRHRLRTALVAREGSLWSKGPGEIVPYGLERLDEARKAGYLILVEGESDCWTLWYHHFPALGIPGAEMVKTLEATHLAGIPKLYIVQEPDTAGAKFVKTIEQRLQDWQLSGKAYVVSLAPAKDPNDLHKLDRQQFTVAFQRALDRAEPLFLTRPLPQSTPSSTESQPSPFTLQELLAKVLPPVRWAIPGILPEGLTLLAGKPKLGKSWLALSVALAISAGGYAMGKQPVTQGEVLYLALEDNERRLQGRAKQLLASMSSVPKGIEFALSWPRLDQGGLASLEEYVQAHPAVRLVVIDTWAKISPQSQSRQRSQYDGDYEALTPLKTLADTYRVSILAVHHLRKMSSNDVMDEIAGSIGMTGAVDGALILKRERGQGEATLFVTGRDIEQEQQLALTFDYITALWTLVGNAEEYQRSKERQEIIDLLAEQLPKGMTPRQVAEALDKNYHTTRSLLSKMEDAAEVRHDNNRYFAVAINAGDQHGEPSLQQRPESDPTTAQAPRQFDDTDYVDDADYDNAHTASTLSESAGPLPLSQGSALLQGLPPAETTSTTADVQQGKDDVRDDCTNCNQRHHCNQRNQPATDDPEQVLTSGSRSNGESEERYEVPTQNGTEHPRLNKQRCPHHPHARWVRFDPSGQAWCNKMDCWDCYRLMKIGEALDYCQLLVRPGSTFSIDVGINAWSMFVTAQTSFAVLTATQQALALCKTRGVEEPDLSIEYQRLVPTW